MKLPTLLSFALTCGFAFCQGGSLTPPPGSPAPTMKSLDQVEARTPLVEGATGVSIIPGSGNITINQSGSYYLTKNLSVSSGAGVSIISDNVTLNLNGFTIHSDSNPTGGNGVFIASKSVTVMGGRIASQYDYETKSGSGFLNGIRGSGPGPIHIKNITIVGCTGDGIQLDQTPESLCSVESCLVQSVGGIGIIAGTVRNSNTTKCESGGIKCLFAANCMARTNSSNAIEADLASNCYAYSATGHGINGTSIINSHATTSEGTAIKGYYVAQSYGEANSGVGLDSDYLVVHSVGRTAVSDGNQKLSIKAGTAVACRAINISSIINKYLMP